MDNHNQPLIREGGSSPIMPQAPKQAEAEHRSPSYAVRSAARRAAPGLGKQLLFLRS